MNQLADILKIFKTQKQNSMNMNGKWWTAIICSCVRICTVINLYVLSVCVCV